MLSRPTTIRGDFWNVSRRLQTNAPERGGCFWLSSCSAGAEGSAILDAFLILGSGK